MRRKNVVKEKNLFREGKIKADKDLKEKRELELEDAKKVKINFILDCRRKP